MIIPLILYPYYDKSDDCPAYINTRISHFGHHKIELADLVKYDKTFKLASFVQKTKRLEKF